MIPRNLSGDNSLYGLTETTYFVRASAGSASEMGEVAGLGDGRGRALRAG